MNWAVVEGVQISASKVALGHISVGWSCFGAAALRPRVELGFWTQGRGGGVLLSSTVPVQGDCRLALRPFALSP